MCDQRVTETSTRQHSQQTDIHVPGGIQTYDLSRRAAVDLCLRPRGKSQYEQHQIPRPSSL